MKRLVLGLALLFIPLTPNPQPKNVNPQTVYVIPQYNPYVYELYKEYKKREMNRSTIIPQWRYPTCPVKE